MMSGIFPELRPTVFLFMHIVACTCIFKCRSQELEIRSEELEVRSQNRPVKHRAGETTPIPSPQHPPPDTSPG